MQQMIIPSAYRPWLFLGVAFLATTFASIWLSPTPEQSITNQLAYIGADGNIYLFVGSTEERRQLTTDASVRIEGSGRSYHRLAWSPDNQLAYASVERTQQRAASELYIADPATGQRQLVGASDAHFVIYMHWSPACQPNVKCTDLAYLIEENDEITLRLIDQADGAYQNQVVATGWPFYFSWSSAGDAIWMHRNGGRVDHEAATFAQYHIPTEVIQPLESMPGRMLAPAGAPHNDSWLAVLSDGTLTLINGNQQTAIANSPNGDIAFAWSPDGTQIAYAIRKVPSNPFYDAIHVYDVASKQSQRVIDVGLRSIAFFWSPTGNQLAYIQRMEVGNDVWMQWRTVAPDGSGDRGFLPFNPTPQMRFIVSSFNQYAQSHRLWSPDGRYLVYAARGADLEDQIFIVDTYASNGEAIAIAEGSLAIWAWR